MSFRFPLQAVLHFRQGMEHQQELRLRAANQQVARVRHLLAQLDAGLRETRSSQMRNLEAGTSAAELHFQMSCESVYYMHRRRLEEELARVEKLRDAQRQIFQQARRDHETLKSLHDRQLWLYKKEAARLEQRRLDDLFLLRRSSRS
jgi:flagellar export protein FliJ